MNVSTISASSAHRPSPMTVFKLSTFCIVTGASRGLGREIALQLVQGWTREGEYIFKPGVGVVSRARLGSVHHSY